MTKSKQTAQPNKRKTPKASEIETKKAAFLKALRESGNITWALENAKLNRRTAYDHLNKDSEFADAWMEVLEIASDELISEARARAVGYEIDENGNKKFRKASDRMLIFLLKRTEFHRKWRNRVLQTAQISMNIISNEGPRIGLTNKQIEELQLALDVGYEKVPMV